MTYRSISNHGRHRDMKVPFAEFTAPMGYVGEVIFGAMEASTRFIRQAYKARKIKALERATIKELSALEDWVLKDIGVSRSDIPNIARFVAENPGVDPRVMCK